MFQVKDKTGQEIFLKDRVLYETEDDMGALITGEGFVICIPSEEMVQIQPINEGTPIFIPPEKIGVTESLIQDIGSLQSNKEFQEYIAKIEKRYESAVQATKSKTKTTSKKLVEVVQIDLDL